jgi:hypothetical protein
MLFDKAGGRKESDDVLVRLFSRRISRSGPQSQQQMLLASVRSFDSLTRPPFAVGGAELKRTRSKSESALEVV